MCTRYSSYLPGYEPHDRHSRRTDRSTPYADLTTENIKYLTLARTPIKDMTYFARTAQLLPCATHAGSNAKGCAVGDDGRLVLGCLIGVDRKWGCGNAIALPLLFLLLLPLRVGAGNLGRWGILPPRLARHAEEL